MARRATIQLKLHRQLVQSLPLNAADHERTSYSLSSGAADEHQNQAAASGEFV
jgi:hypothetical protein